MVDSTSPDEGLLQAYLDDELAQEDRAVVEARIEADPLWAEALLSLRSAAGILSRGLAAQDVLAPSSGPPPWIRVLKGKVQSVPKRFPLARAAAVVLLFAGALATGLPGSPVREWFASQFDEATVSPAASAAVEAPAPAVIDEAGEVGVRVGTPAGNLEVVLDALPVGAELVVSLVQDGEAGVYGPTGTQFRTSDGQVTVLNPAGVVRVEVPRTLSGATIMVGDTVYFTKAGEILQVTGPITARGDEEIRFAPTLDDAPSDDGSNNGSNNG